MVCASLSLHLPLSTELLQRKSITRMIILTKIRIALGAVGIQFCDIYFFFITLVDIFHEDSDQDEVVHYDDDGDHDWR